MTINCFLLYHLYLFKIIFRNQNNFISSFQFKSGAIGTYQSFWLSPDSWSVKLYGAGLTVEFKPLEEGIVTLSNFKIKKIKPDIEELEKIDEELIGKKLLQKTLSPILKIDFTIDTMEMINRNINSE